MRMTTKTVGFIGGGSVTRIILEGLNREQKLPAHIVVSDPNPAPLAKLKERFPQISTAPGDNPKAPVRTSCSLPSIRPQWVRRSPGPAPEGAP